MWRRALFIVSPATLRPPGCTGFGQNATLKSDSQFYFGHIGFYGCKNQFLLVKWLLQAIKAKHYFLIFTYTGIYLLQWLYLQHCCRLLFGFYAPCTLKNQRILVFRQDIRESTKPPVLFQNRQSPGIRKSLKPLPVKSVRMALL